MVWLLWPAFSGCTEEHTIFLAGSFKLVPPPPPVAALAAHRQPCRSRHIYLEYFERHHMEFVTSILDGRGRYILSKHVCVCVQLLWGALTRHTLQLRTLWSCIQEAPGVPFARKSLSDTEELTLVSTDLNARTAACTLPLGHLCLGHHGPPI